MVGPAYMKNRNIVLLYQIKSDKRSSSVEQRGSVVIIARDDRSHCQATVPARIDECPLFKVLAQKYPFSATRVRARPFS